MEDKRLTIAIPTYNRNEILFKNLTYLLPQICSACKLLIVDNASDIPVSQTLKEVLFNYRHLDITIIRNNSNLGANANVLHCMEFCETKYLWIIGDDDKVENDAVITILDYIERYPDCVMINYSFDSNVGPIRNINFITEGLHDFIHRFDCFEFIAFVSNGVINNESLLPFIKFGYFYQCSCFPIIAMLLMGLGDKGKCCFSTKRLIKGIAQITPEDLQHSNLNVALGISILFDLPLTKEDRNELVEKITSWTRKIRLHRYVFKQLLLRSANKYDDESINYIYNTIYRRLFSYEENILTRIEAKIFQVMLYMPDFSMSFVSFLYWLKHYKLFDIDSLRNNKFTNEPIIDRYKRI